MVNTETDPTYRPTNINILPSVTLSFLLQYSKGEGVGTLKITTSKGQNVESFFRMIRFVKSQKDQNVESLFRTSKITLLKRTWKVTQIRLSTF
jgi:hypothetical protein